MIASQAAAFHASPRWENEETGSKKITATADGTVVATSPSNSGLGWFALPLGIVAAVPLIKWEWLMLNEETQVNTTRLSKL